MKGIIALAVCMLAIGTSAIQYNILVLVPTIEKNSWNFMQAFIEELVLKRGHKVTCITSTRPGDTFFFQVHDNYEQILIEPPYDLNSSNLHPDVEWFHEQYSSFWTTATVAKKSAIWALGHRSVQEFLDRNDLHFDLVINDEFYHESWLMFGYKFKAPTITIASTGIKDYLDRYMGFITPYSHVCNSWLEHDEKMTFRQRWSNTISALNSWFYHDYFHLSSQNRVAKEYFSDFIGGPLPHVKDLIKNISIILVNEHRMMSPPRPAMPSLVYIGGANIKKEPKSLPIEIQRFIDNALDGIVFVYFEKEFERHKVQIILDAFAITKYQILWQYDNSSLGWTELPANVLIYKELPRHDILAYGKIRLFVSNIDYFEAIYNGVPIFMLPMNMKQILRAKRIERIGCGIGFEWDHLTVKNMVASLIEIFENPKYMNKAKKKSIILRKNIVHPMDRAIWWIEYVIRHKGANHLKSYGVEIPLIFYLQWEIFGPIILLIASSIMSSILFFLNFCLPPPDYEPRNFDVPPYRPQNRNNHQNRN